MWKMDLVKKVATSSFSTSAQRMPVEDLVLIHEFTNEPGPLVSQDTLLS